LQQLKAGSAEIPTQIAQMTALQRMNFFDSRVSGNIPSQVGDLTLMQYFDFAGNKLVGTLPVQLSQMTDLFRLFLVNNALTGPVPPEYSALAKLTTQYQMQSMALCILDADGYNETQRGVYDPLVACTCNQVGSVRSAFVNNSLPCFCYETLTPHSFVPSLTLPCRP
jgi:hypothetical protein